MSQPDAISSWYQGRPSSIGDAAIVIAIAAAVSQHPNQFVATGTGILVNQIVGVGDEGAAIVRVQRSASLGDGTHLIVGEALVIFQFNEGLMFGEKCAKINHDNDAVFDEAKSGQNQENGQLSDGAKRG